MIVELLLEPILKDLKLAAGREVLLHVNGLGGTPLMELYLLHHPRAGACAPQGLSVGALAGGQLHDLAGNGRRLADRHRAGRRAQARCGTRR